MRHINWGSKASIGKSIVDIIDNDWKEKVKTETFEHLAREYGSIKIISIDFLMIEITSDGESKGLHCHMVLGI